MEGPIELTTENRPEDALQSTEFAVINFYDDSEASIDFEDIFGLTYLMYNNYESFRHLSVVFAQVDVKKYP